MSDTRQALAELGLTAALAEKGSRGQATACQPRHVHAALDTIPFFYPEPYGAAPDSAGLTHMQITSVEIMTQTPALPASRFAAWRSLSDVSMTLAP